MAEIKIGDTIWEQGLEWRVVMLTSKYATIELIRNPKISKMIKLQYTM